MKILVTGSVGFIGYHLSKKLVELGNEVIGIDNINDYYDVELKLARSEILSNKKNYKFYKCDLVNYKDLEQIFKKDKPSIVINLAAQAGVRYSLSNPSSYIESNIVGFFNILELSKKYNIDHLLYASSSSVYGGNKKIPFSELDNVDHPLNLYAASKRSNELLAHSYSHLYKIPTTGLRFFTVYGPWGRPDMALFKFVKAILNDEKIDVYNQGEHSRDFTYIDDITESIYRLINKIPAEDSNWNNKDPQVNSSSSPWKIYNIGNNQPIKLLNFISIIEKNLGKKAKLNFLPLQAGDVKNTFADINNLVEKIDFKPSTTIDLGISNFIKWYKDFYKV